MCTRANRRLHVVLYTYILHRVCGSNNDPHTERRGIHHLDDRDRGSVILVRIQPVDVFNTEAAVTNTHVMSWSPRYNAQTVEILLEDCKSMTIFTRK